MHKRIESRLISLALSLGGLSVATSCGVGAIPGEPAAVPPSPCHGTLAQATIGPMGGRVEVTQGPLRGARVDVPPGAVAQNVTLTLRIARDLAIPWSDAVPNTNALCVETDAPAQPTGQTFAADHLPTLVLPYDQAKLEGASLHSLAMAKVSSIGEQFERLGGALLVAEKQQRAGHEITGPGIYQIIKVGPVNYMFNANLSLLFVMDNSGSMTAKQKEITKLLPQFFDQVTLINSSKPEIAKCINFRLGVITTDMGNSAPDFGDNGRLQNKFCNERGLQGDALRICNELGCDDPMLPPVAKRSAYISRPAAKADEKDNKIALALAKKEFQCRAFVGNNGSGIEQPLEATDKFISKDGEGATFFQKNGMYGVFFMTDEGDCSVPQGQRDAFFSSPILDRNVRCLQQALECRENIATTAAQPMRTMVTNCKVKKMGTSLENPGNYASRLRNFVKGQEPGTVDFDQHLFVRGLWPLAFDGDPALGKLSTTISFPLGLVNPQPAIDPKDAFCVDKDDNQIMGHPQLRMNDFVGSLNGKDTVKTGPARIEIGNICNRVDRAGELGGKNGILDDLAQAITSRPMLCPVPVL